MKRILLLLLSLCTLAACQPTPETEPIVSHADVDPEALLSEASAAFAAEQIAFPARWDDEIKTEIWAVPIHADVVTSGQKTFPVRVVERKAFTASDAERIANVFFPSVSGVREGMSRSSAELAEALQNAIDTGRDVYAENLRKKLLNGDYTEDFTPVMALSFSDVPFDCCIRTENGVGYIYVRETYLELNGAEGGTVWAPGPWDDEGPYVDSEPLIPNPAITKDAAIDEAMRFLHDAGITGFTAEDAKEAVYFDNFYTKSLSDGWYLELVRTYEYRPLRVDQSSSGPMQFEWDEVSQPWYREVVHIYVSDRGVQYLCWRDPLEVTDIKTENVGLLPFDEATTAIKRIFTYGLPRLDGPGRFGYSMEITGLYLSVALQPVKDDPEHAYLIPAWYIRVDIHDINLKTDVPYPEVIDTAFYGFSALDGSYIRPMLPIGAFE